ncbi:putative orfan [Tupanvirus soda lake]|uniref:Orfan n=2 Tax=Tupanvirus TaxID=2094720 RepID=A0AC62AAX7_9VIRU|nr:putative orfan [Tupanvirus soda lake]QKU34942.1 putative orfan [Tupanvirus soda lake]
MEDILEINNRDTTQIFGHTESHTGCILHVDINGTNIFIDVLKCVRNTEKTNVTLYDTNLKSGMEIVFSDKKRLLIVDVPSTVFDNFQCFVSEMTIGLAINCFVNDFTKECEYVSQWYIDSIKGIIYCVAKYKKNYKKNIESSIVGIGYLPKEIDTSICESEFKNKLYISCKNFIDAINKCKINKCKYVCISFEKECMIFKKWFKNSNTTKTLYETKNIKCKKGTKFIGSYVYALDDLLQLKKLLRIAEKYIFSIDDNGVLRCIYIFDEGIKVDSYTKPYSVKPRTINSLFDICLAKIINISCPCDIHRICNIFLEQPFKFQKFKYHSFRSAPTYLRQLQFKTKDRLDLLK